MSIQKPNDDKTVAGLARRYFRAAIATENFNDAEKLPIFWGPGQLTTNYPEYTPPTKEEWKKKALQPLMIPVVARFIHASQDSYNTDAYPEDGEPDLPYFIVVGIFPYQPPYPGDYIIRIFNTQSSITSHYSILPFDDSTFPATYVADNWFVGMKYRIPFYSGMTGALSYVTNGILGAGFYARGAPTPTLVVPFT